MKKRIVKTLYIEDMEDVVSQHHIKDWLQGDLGVKEVKLDHTNVVIAEEGGTSQAFISRLKSLIRSADIIVFDFGGFQQMGTMGGGYSLVDYWNRFFMEQIRENPSKDWRCVSCLQTFEDEDKEKLKALGVYFQH